MTQKSKINSDGSNNTLNISDVNNKKVYDSYNTTNNITNIYPTTTIEKPDTNRPYLKDRNGRLVRCYGVIMGKYSQYSRFYTIVNLVDQHGKYVADHVQLDFKEDEFDYSCSNTKSNYIRITGIVKEYCRSNETNDFEIDITEPVEFFDDRYHNYNEILDIDDDTISMERIEYLSRYLSVSNSNGLYELLDKLQNELNTVSVDFEENFIFDYIINQYTLNTAVHDLYKNGIDRNKLNNNAILDLLMLIGSTIFLLRSHESFGLYNICKQISMECNTLQGVLNYIKDDIEFKNFCSSRLSLSSKRKRGVAWHHVLLRYKNFGKNTGNVNKNSIAMRSYIILDKYIQ